MSRQAVCLPVLLRREAAAAVSWGPHIGGGMSKALKRKLFSFLLQNCQIFKTFVLLRVLSFAFFFLSCVCCCKNSYDLLILYLLLLGGPAAAAAASGHCRLSLT